MRGKNHQSALTLLSLLTIIALASPALTGCAQKMSQDEWLSKFQPAFTVRVCESGYLQECFGFSTEKCETTVASATRVCFAELRGEMPDDMSGSGGHWGQKVGSYADVAFDAGFHDRKVDSEKCNDPNAWL